MGDSKEQSQVDELKNVFEELREIDSSALPLVKEAIDYVKGKSFLTGHGAFTDTLIPEEGDADARRKMQRTLPMLPDNGLVDPDRRRLIWAAIGGGMVGTMTGVLSDLVTNAITRPDVFRDSFVRKVLGLHSNRRALKLWHDELLREGRTDECEFIDAIASHGEGFWEADQAIAWIERVEGDERLSDFSRKYLQINWANHHRYLGQTRDAFDLMATFPPLPSDNIQLNALAINQKYMNKHLALGGVEEYQTHVPMLNLELSQAMQSELGIDAASLSLDSFRSAEQISVECLCLKGWFFMNQCISARSEAEAMSALEIIDRYRSMLVQLFVRRAYEQGDDWMAVRLSGEAISNYARIAPIAWAQGWSRVLHHCFRAFYSEEEVTDAFELAAFKQYHKDELKYLRSPLWIQIALVKSMDDEVMDGSGSVTLAELLPATERYDIRHHTVLQRTLDALRVAFGRDPTAINELNTLFSVDDHLMIECVKQMLQRRGSYHSI